VSKERALRRAARMAEAERERVRRSRREQRAARRRALLLWLRPPRRRTGRLYARRGYPQRVLIAAGALALLALIWWQFEDLATRIALTALVAVAAPAAVVLTFDRNR
jgi:hypothetical protein